MCMCMLFVCKTRIKIDKIISCYLMKLFSFIQIDSIEIIHEANEAWLTLGSMYVLVVCYLALTKVNINLASFVFSCKLNRLNRLNQTRPDLNRPEQIREQSDMSGETTFEH